MKIFFLIILLFISNLCGASEPSTIICNAKGEWFKSTSPGVNTNHTLDESHKSFYDTNNNPCYYEFAVLPKDWLV